LRIGIIGIGERLGQRLRLRRHRGRYGDEAGEGSETQASPP
jgi:hypothetical protein